MVGQGPEPSHGGQRVQEKEMREVEELLRLLVDAVRDYAIFVLDPEGYIVSWNPGAERIKGYQSAEVLGRHVSIFYPQEAIKRAHPQFELQVAREQGRYQEDGIRLRKGGAPFWANVTITALFGTQGELRGFAKVTRDITEAKQAEEAIRQANLELERHVQERTEELTHTIARLRDEIRERQKAEASLREANELALSANKAKNAFLANMSHEIRTPLAAVLGFSDVLCEEQQNESERRAAAQAVKRNGQLLVSIINDILDLSRIEANKLVIRQQEVQLKEFLGDVSSLLRLQAEEKGLNFSLVARGPLPSHIYTDPIRLKQILSNIVGNAIKFTEHGAVKLGLRETVDAQHNTSLEFEVTDTGPGIAEPAGLFEPFTQLDESLTRQHGGTGLGLALARQLAQALGGDVQLSRTSLGQGSSFLVWVRTSFPERPLGKSLGQVPTPRNEERGFKHAADEIQLNLRILLVEDVADNRMLVSRFLKRAGASVDFAENGKLGVEKALAENFDVILMDLRMPIMDGYEATRQLRAAGYKKPIFALTAHAMQEERERCLTAGFDAHVIKPIDRQQLLEQLAQIARQQT